MSGTRFARTGRVRFLIFFAIIILMVLCVAMFQSTQNQLDETRELRIRCEHQQEDLNRQLQSIVEEKYSVQKDLEHERKDHMQAKSKLEQELKDMQDLYAKSKLQWGVQTGNDEKKYKILQSKYEELEKNYAQTNNHQMENVNGLEKKLQSLRSELQKEKNLQSNELALWKEKYNTILKEKEHLEGLLSAEETHKKVLKLEGLVEDYRANCDYIPKEEQQQINSPLQSPQTTNQNNPQREEHVRGIDKPQNLKDQQVSNIEKIKEQIEKPFNKTTNPNNIKNINNIASKEEKTINNNNNNNNNNNEAGVGLNFIAKESSVAKTNDNLLPFGIRNNHSLIINSVENFQIAQKPIKRLSEEQQETQLKQQPNENEIEGSQNKEKDEQKIKGKLVAPLSAPKKPSSTTTSKTPLKALEENAHLKRAANSTSSGDNKNVVPSSPSLVGKSSVLPPLAVPPNSPRKLPDNVAPIPEHFEELLKNEIKDAAAADGTNLADVNAAIEDTRKMENDENKNNRYSNIVKDMEQKESLAANAAAANGDSGAHEIKDQDDHLMNEKDFNLPEAGGNDDGNFFDAENKDKDKNNDDNNDDDDPVEAVGNGKNEDIAVKNHNQNLDADNLKNEIAGDQGKDFPDGLHLEEGMEEEEDEDDYSNPGARPQADKAIRI